jgi:hypothetical protein
MQPLKGLLGEADMSMVQYLQGLMITGALRIKDPTEVQPDGWWWWRPHLNDWLVHDFRGELCTATCTANTHCAHPCRCVPEKRKSSSGKELPSKAIHSIAIQESFT